MGNRVIALVSDPDVLQTTPEGYGVLQSTAGVLFPAVFTTRLEAEVYASAARELMPIESALPRLEQVAREAVAASPDRLELSDHIDMFGFRFNPKLDEEAVLHTKFWAIVQTVIAAMREDVA